MFMNAKLKYALALLALLLGSGEPFQGAQIRSLVSHKRDIFDSNNLNDASTKGSRLRPSYLFSASSSPSFQSRRSDIQTKRRSSLQNLKACLDLIRKRTIAICVALAIVFSQISIAGAAPGSGRAGGSFKSSPRPSISRPYRASGTWGYNRQPRGMLLGSPRMVVHSSGWHNGPAVAVAPPQRMTIAEITVLVTVAAIMIQGFMNNSKRQMDAGPLGAGATVVALTVAMNVPDRRDPNSILKRLRKLALASNTSNREGVQDLLSEVSLELLRQEKSIVSASAKAKYFHSPELAERQFRSESVQTRSRFDREVVNKFGDQLLVDDIPDIVNDDSDPTMAVVSITMAIEGKSLASTQIRSRDDLVRSLSQIAADSQVDSCLLSGEVLWSPEVPGERITNEDLYTDFPNLIPL